jgi:hypothetical protein
MGTTQDVGGSAASKCSEDGNLVLIRHRSGEHFRVRESDLSKPGTDLIPLYEVDGEKRKRSDAWFGSGRPSDIEVRHVELVSPDNNTIIPLDAGGTVRN